MDKRQSHTKDRADGVRSDKASPAARPARQPRRTLIAGLLWIVFMLVVWFQAPGVQLPTFFQRLVGFVNALLSMLVVMFAVREYGKRFNRLPLPVLGRVSTSRVAGGLVFLAVLGWWISPWAPIPVGQPEPDLWRLLEQGLDLPLLQVVDTNLATLVQPVPSADARQAATTFATNADPRRSALVAIATGKFDAAEALLNEVPVGSAADLAEQARAQLDLYRAHYAAASRRYGEMLKVQPRREDFLAHGALAAAMAGDFSTAGAWAEQLLEQARARGHVSARSVEATNLLAVVNLLAGDYAEALRVRKEMLGGREGSLVPRDSTDLAGPQDAAAANNAAVILLLAGTSFGSGESTNPSPSSGFALAQELWLDRHADGREPHESPDPHRTLARYNLGMAALLEARYDQAEALLTESLAAWRGFARPPTSTCLAINLNALARLDCIEGRYGDGESWAHEAAEPFAAASADDPSVFAYKATLAELDANQHRYDQAIEALQQLIHEAELGRRGLSPHHPYVAILKLRLAGILLRDVRNADAESTADEALKILDDAGLSDSRSAAAALRISGLAALRQGNHEQVQRQFDRAMKLLRPSDDIHPTQPASLELAALLAAQGELAGDLQNYTAAADDYHQAIDQLDLIFGAQAADHPLRAEYLHALGRLTTKDAK